MKIYMDFKEMYFKLRKEQWSLIDKIEQQDELIEKLSKELAEKTELLAEYHLRFGEECLDIIKNKRLRIKKRTQIDDDDLEVEI